MYLTRLKMQLKSKFWFELTLKMPLIWVTMCMDEKKKVNFHHLYSKKITKQKYNLISLWYLSFNMKTKQGFDILTFTAGSSELVSRSKVIGGGRVWPSYHKIKFWWMKKCAFSYSLSATQMKWIFFSIFSYQNSCKQFLAS